MNRSKKLCILLGVLIVSCVAALIAMHTEERKEEIKTSGETVLKIESAKVSALSWEVGDETLRFHRDGDWYYDDDEAFPVDEEAIDTLLEQFRSFGAAFTIENADDLSQYGLDAPECTITITTEDETYTILLGDYSTMDSQRYVSIGDGNVYLAVSDPLDVYDVALSDLIRHDRTPSFDEVYTISFSGAENYTITYEKDSGKSYCADDVFFTQEDAPLDTSRVRSYISALRYLTLSDYVTYNAGEDDLHACGLDDPELTISVAYMDDGTEDTFLLQISRDLEAREASAEEDDGKAVTAYARVGDSGMIYQLSSSDYQTLMAAGYNDLRHQELFSGDFDDVTGMDITLDGENYSLSASGDGSARSWYYQGEEVDIDTLREALEALTAAEFTTERPSQAQEIRLTLHLDSDAFPSLTLALYRWDGTQCAAIVNGEPFALVSRSKTVTLMEAVRSIVLGG